MENITTQEQTSMFITARRAIDDIYVSYAKSVGLSYLGLIILETINNSPNGCTQKEIVEKLNLPKQTVNVIIKSFLEQGYIDLKEVCSDRRNKEILLSKQGLEFANKVLGNLTEAEVKVMEKLTYEQRQDILNIMKKIEMSLKEILLPVEPK